MKKPLHKELKISFIELGALLATRELLHRGLMRHTRCPVPAEHAFLLSETCIFYHGCSTVGCIGGTMALLMGKTISEADTYVMSTAGGLRKLFFPPYTRNSRTMDSYDPVTPKQAVKAIDNFLRTGKPIWEKVLPNSYYT